MLVLLIDAAVTGAFMLEISLKTTHLFFKLNAILYLFPYILIKPMYNCVDVAYKTAHRFEEPPKNSRKRTSGVVQPLGESFGNGGTDGLRQYLACACVSS